ncbi:MAG: CapA family protein [Desulfobulbus oligotrophicus]|jgi:hypothetical protein|nr:CapA family protein [Desulfobulbus oligotrophicus]
MKPIKCIFVGDLALGDHPKSVGFGFYSMYRGGIPSGMRDGLLPKSYEFDALFGNLEFTLGDKSLSGNSYQETNCRGIVNYADFLQKAGFTVLNIANNHIYQHGMESFDKTIEVLSKRNIGLVGLREKTNTSNILRIDDTSLCFLGWSARPRQGFADQPPYCELDEKSCYEEIAGARKKHSIVIVSLHWGDEFIEIPSEEEKRIARRMIDSGASVVVGHHPHVIREVEQYNNGLIAYSLGNFICDMIWNEKTRKTAFLYVEFSEGTLSKWEFVQGRIGDDYFPNFQNTISNQQRIYEKLYKKLATNSYQKLMQNELRQHQLLTGWHMLRNFYRYNLATWLSMLGGAIKSRLGTTKQ